MSDLSIKYDQDNGFLHINNTMWGIDVVIPDVDFALLTIIHKQEDVEITELVLNYQMQF